MLSKRTAVVFLTKKPNAETKNFAEAIYAETDFEVFIVADDLICDLYDVFCAAVVLFQLHYMHFFVIFLELQDIFNCGTSERVNGLCVVTDHANVFVSGSEEFDDFVLSRVGILVLIYQDITEFVLIFMEAIGVILEQIIEFKQ